MKEREFKRLAETPRKRYHPIQHEVKGKHNLAKRTVFYMKEYGPRTSVTLTILRQSIGILLLASILSSLGGVALEAVSSTLVLPLLVVIPALNHMVGSFGTIVASKFTTALYMGRVRGDWWRLHFLHRLFWMVFVVAIFAAVYVASLAVIVSIFGGFLATTEIFRKLVIITVLSTLLLTFLIFNISVVGGLWIYKRGEDPDNFLIPITTSVADFGSLILFAYLVGVFF